jgi:predicted Zn-dependent protease
MGLKSNLNIVRIGNNISFSSLKEIGRKILDSFQGTIKEFQLAHYNIPFLDCIDARLLTKILHEEVGGHTLGITDADLRTHDHDEFYSTIIGGKNPKNDVAVVSTKRLSPEHFETLEDYELYISRTLKVSLHEVGHNLGLIDHASYKTAADGSLCPMSKGEFNKFGYRGYVQAIVDGRGITFCEECSYFLKKVYGLGGQLTELMRDGLGLCDDQRAPVQFGF